MDTASTKREALRTALRVLEVFRDSNPEGDMNLGEIMAFLEISINEESDVSVGDIASRLNFKLATMSRYIQTLSDFNRRKEPGLAWVEYTPSALDFRVKLPKVSLKGHRVINNIVRAINVGRE